MKPLALALSGLALACSSPAAAAQITYTVVGTYDLLSFPALITITGVGDTDDALFDADSALTIVPLSMLTFTLGDETTSFVTDGNFFAFSDAGLNGFELADGVSGVSFFSSALIGYDGVSAIGPVQASLILFSLPLDGQQVELNALGPLSFSAVLGGAAAVPEPATWAMMIAGFGLIGGTVRRRTLAAL